MAHGRRPARMLEAEASPGAPERPYSGSRVKQSRTPSHGRRARSGCRVRGPPRLQRRSRAGFSPASCPAHVRPDAFRVWRITLVVEWGECQGYFDQCWGTLDQSGRHASRWTFRAEGPSHPLDIRQAGVDDGRDGMIQGGVRPPVRNGSRHRDGRLPCPPEPDIPDRGETPCRWRWLSRSRRRRPWPAPPGPMRWSRRSSMPRPMPEIASAPPIAEAPRAAAAEARPRAELPRQSRSTPPSRGRRPHLPTPTSRPIALVPASARRLAVIRLSPPPHRLALTPGSRR